MRGVGGLQRQLLAEVARGEWSYDPSGTPATLEERQAFLELERDGRIRLDLCRDERAEWVEARVTANGLLVLAVVEGVVG